LILSTQLQTKAYICRVKKMSFLGLFVVCYGCPLGPPATPKVLGNMEPSTLLGEWQSVNDDETHSFSLRIWQSQDSLLGAYCAIVDGKIDCADPNLQYECIATLNPFVPDLLETSFKGYNSSDSGRVRLQLIQDELYWEMQRAPRSGICLAPKQTVLHKVSRR
jgi:hypothetical protein